jgi:hypothetical protein
MTHYAGVRLALIVVLGFNALSQIAGGIGLITGAVAPGLAILRGTPFADYMMPGVILVGVAGGSSLVALAVVWLASRLTGDFAGIASGGITAGWIVGEVMLLGVISWPLQALYLATGLLTAGLAARLWLADWERAHPHQPTRGHAIA